MSGVRGQCSIEGCERPHQGRTWCKMHYYRWYYHGDPTFTKIDRSKTESQRFWAKVNFHAADNCWEWTASLSPTGYGHFGVGRIMIAAHIWSYQNLIGLVPPGLELDHLCRNRKCVRPLHLEPVTHAENMRRGLNANKTHCPHGHEYTLENVYLKPSGGRQCKTCDRARKHKQRAA